MPATTFMSKTRGLQDSDPEFQDFMSSPTPENKQRVVEWLKPTVSSALQTSGGGDQSLEPRAWILAFEALNTYDPKKGAAVKTHVFNSLQRLNRVRAERSTAMHVPENVREDSVVIGEFVRDYTDRFGIEPSQALIADKLSMSTKRVRKAMTQGERLESSSLSEHGDAAGTRSRDPADIWADYVYHDLSETDKKIFEWTTGYGGSKIIPKIQIASKLKVSPAAISIRISQIQKRLQEAVG